MIWGILWFTGVLVADLWLDYKKWLDSRKVDHTLEAWQRAICLLPGFSMAAGDSLLLFVKLLLVGFFIYWTVFDGVYNRLRGLSWWFPGSDDGPKNDAWLDRVQYWLGKKYSIVVKLGGIAISLFFLIK